MYQERKLKFSNALPALIAMAAIAVCKIATAGQSMMFTFPNGFTGTNGNPIFYASNARLVGANMVLTPSSGAHFAGSGWYITQQNIQSFTTKFTFQITPTPSTVPATAALAFVVQNSNASTNTNYGPPYYVAAGDANVGGFGSYNPDIGSWQQPIGNSIEVKFDLGGGGQVNYPSGGTPNSTGLYISGGPYSNMIAANDLNPYGINLYSGHIMSCTVVYDGSFLTMVLQDTVTNTQARYVWPLNLTAITHGNTAWVGFTAGQVAPEQQEILTWTYWSGYNTRLATPTFSVAPGAYPSAQSVSISGPPGASIYYTTNGLLPTSSSKQYSGPIAVSSSEVINAVAIQSGYTDSYVATANYQVAPSGTPIINFPSGFANASGLVVPVGRSTLSGSNIQLTDTTATSEAGAAWYAAPVNAQTFSTNFTVQFSNVGSGGNGMTFCLQNQPAATDSPSLGPPGTYVSGGPTAFSNSNNSLGYGYLGPSTLTGPTGGLLSSVAVTLNLANNGTGLYTNGVLPSGSDKTVTGVNFASGHPIAVALTYDGTTLSMTMSDTVTGGKFSTNWTVNIPSIVGANTAYVGFTAGTGSGANQNVSAWTYSTSTVSPAIPAAPTNLRVQ
jgi:hypothetical protein